jgi:hypothetical protein
MSALVEQTDGFELIRAEQMGFVDHQDDPAAAFVFFCGQEALGLGDQLGFLSAWPGTQGVDDGQVQAAGSHGRVGQVHDVVRRLVQLADGSAYGDGLADAHLARDHAQQRLGHAEADARHGFPPLRAWLTVSS